MLTIVICCATFEDVECAFYNRLLTHKINKPHYLSQVKWLIINNGGEKIASKLDKLNKKKDVTIIRGVKPPDIIEAYRGSYHHGLALNKALSFVKNRFLLVLDPDFFIVRKNWIRDVTEYMISKKLEFFGAPWHPRYFNKYRYFPCVHCLFVDLKRVNITALNFLPDILNNNQEVVIGNNKSIFIVRLIRGFIKDWQDRSLIGTSRDTGYLLYKKFKDRTSETISPYYKVDIRGLMPIIISPAIYVKILETFIPDRFCFIPKKEGYFSKLGFKDFGFLDTTCFGWEEFIWKNQPFGFHLRRHVNNEINNIKIFKEIYLKLKV